MVTPRVVWAKRMFTNRMDPIESSNSIPLFHMTLEHTASLGHAHNAQEGLDW